MKKINEIRLQLDEGTLPITKSCVASDGNYYIPQDIIDYYHNLCDALDEAIKDIKSLAWEAEDTTEKGYARAEGITNYIEQILERNKSVVKAKYRKKPVIIEAEQLFFDQQPWPDAEYRDWNKQLQVKTLEGWLTVSNGDWIITGVQGEKYPCKDSIFEETYEKVEE